MTNLDQNLLNHDTERSERVYDLEYTCFRQLLWRLATGNVPI